MRQRQLSCGRHPGIRRSSGSRIAVESDSTDRGQVINSRQIVELPLNGRNYSDLALLTTGVRRSDYAFANPPRDGSFNVNGQRSIFNNFLMDGVDNNAYGTSNQGFSNQVVQLTPDAVAEFKVVDRPAERGVRPQLRRRDQRHDEESATRAATLPAARRCISWIWACRKPSRSPTGSSSSFRTEAFNLLNKTNFGNSTTNRASAAFGTIRQTFPARPIQFALRLSF